MNDDEFRTCRRAGCRWPASASLSYRYATREVWITDLGEYDPFHYDLCPHHADALTVPRDWQRVDQRTAPASVREGSASERLGASVPDLDEPGGPTSGAATREADLSPGAAVGGAAVLERTRVRSDRYALLHAELATLAATADRDATAQPTPRSRTPAARPSRAAGEVASARIPRCPAEPGPVAHVEGQLPLDLDRGAATVVRLVRPPR